jgi:hypothetical protein
MFAVVAAGGGGAAAAAVVAATTALRLVYAATPPAAAASLEEEPSLAAQARSIRFLKPANLCASVSIASSKACTGVAYCFLTGDSGEFLCTSLIRIAVPAASIFMLLKIAEIGYPRASSCLLTPSAAAPRAAAAALFLPGFISSGTTTGLKTFDSELQIPDTEEEPTTTAAAP